MFAHVDLDVREPHLGHKVGRPHEGAVRPPVGRCLIDDDPTLLPHEVHVQLKCHCQRNVINLWHLKTRRYWLFKKAYRMKNLFNIDNRNAILTIYILDFEQLKCIQFLSRKYYLKNVCFHVNMERVIRGRNKILKEWIIIMFKKHFRLIKHLYII